MSNCIVGLQYLVFVGDKCIRSAFRYLSQSNGYQYHIFSSTIKNLGANFRAPKSGYRSQKRPAFFPDLFWRSLLGSCFCNSIDKSSINSFGVNKNKRDFDYVNSFLWDQEYGGIFSSHIAGKTYLSNVSWHWLKIFDFCSLRVSEANS